MDRKYVCPCFPTPAATATGTIMGVGEVVGGVAWYFRFRMGDRCIPCGSSDPLTIIDMVAATIIIVLSAYLESPLAPILGIICR